MSFNIWFWHNLCKIYKNYVIDNQSKQLLNIIYNNTTSLMAAMLNIGILNYNFNTKMTIKL